jgi:hypothetical protein
MPKPFSEILNRASQLGGPDVVRPVADGDFFKIPHFTEDFVSARFPDFNGRITLRYPSFGDEVDIDRLTLILGGTQVGRIMAALQTCLEAAPPIWWRPNEQLRTIEPAIDRFPDSPALLGLYTRWIKWRDSFRFGPPEQDAPGTAAADAAPVAGS